MGEYDPADFEILHPGVYTARESDLVAQQLLRNQALEERGPVDAKALAAGTLPADTPGIGPTLPVTEAMVRYNNAKYDPDNRLLNDAERPFQLLLAGKAHPQDEGGKRLIEELHALMRTLEGVVPIAFLPDYDMDSARALVAGVDIWLNTPLRPLEASGTSGMKAAFNGVPSLSVLDGWWVEGCIEGVTGWAIGNDSGADDGDAAALYDKLEQVVLPLYADPAGWARVMKGAISKSASFFNSHRMMRRYATEAYIR